MGAGRDQGVVVVVVSDIWEWEYGRVGHSGTVMGEGGSFGGA